MEMETYPATPELTLPPEYAFMSIDEIGKLRASQRSAQYEAMSAALESGDAYTVNEEAQRALKENSDAEAKKYVAAHLQRDDNPELFDQLTRLVAFASYHKQEGVEWNLGEKNADGNYGDLETSGRSQYETAVAKLVGVEAPKPPTDLPEAPTPEDIQTAQQNLTAARSTLAALSVQRRRKARNGGKNKDLETRYDSAQAAYEEARLNLGALMAQGWRHDQVSPTQLRTNVITHVLDEHQNFTRAELAQLNEDPSRKAKISRFLARHHALFFGGSAVASFGIGYGLGKLVKGTTMSAIGIGGAIALPAAIAGGIAIKTTKSVLQASVGNRVNQIRSQEKRATADFEALTEDVNHDVDETHSHDQMLATAHEHLTNRVDGRVRKDVRNNRNRVIAAAAISGAAGAAGFLVSSEVDHSWPFGHGSHSAPDHDGNNGGGATHEKPNLNDTQPPNQNPAHGGTPVDTGNSGGGQTPSGPNKGLVDGYNPNVTIEHGNGYQVELEQLAGQKDIHLTNAQSWNLYEHLSDKFHGNFLSNDASYKGPGDWRISAPMHNAHWNPAVIHEMNQWLEDNKVKAS